MKVFKIAILILSALALFYASSSRLIKPNKAVFLSSYVEKAGNTLETHIDLLSEIRGVGAVMLIGGIIVLLGAIREDLMENSFLVASLIFAGVVIGRSLSFFLEGMPSQDLVRVFTVEAVLGALNIVCLGHTLI
ncbi:MAG: DUF4345 family protein, partial [Bacteroidota bacterium]